MTCIDRMRGVTITPRARARAREAHLLCAHAGLVTGDNRRGAAWLEQRGWVLSESGRSWESRRGVVASLEHAIDLQVRADLRSTLQARGYEIERDRAWDPEGSWYSISRAARDLARRKLARLPNVILLEREPGEVTR